MDPELRMWRAKGKVLCKFSTAWGVGTQLCCSKINCACIWICFSLTVLRGYAYFFFLNFSLGHFYSLVFRFIHSFLDCLESTEERIEDSLHLSSSVFDFQNFNLVLFLVSISAEITHLILHFAYIFH